VNEGLSSHTVTIATSIMPRRIEVQQAAIGSWYKLGFKVISVNVQSEADQVCHLFPGVDFVSVNQKPGASHLVLISDLLAALASCDTTLCGIVNSDILLEPMSDFSSFLLNKTIDNALLFGSRIDVDDINSRSGVPYSVGYDYFFFRKEQLPLQLVGDFYIGTPWWDFWFPISLAIKGFILRQLIVPVGYHVNHGQGWTHKDLGLGQRKFIATISELLLITDKSTDLSDRIRSIIDVQGMEGFAGQIPSILLLDSELVVNGPQSVPLESLSVIVDIMKKHRDRYEMFIKSRSWRWTAPARFLTSRYRALIGSKTGKNN